MAHTVIVRSEQQASARRALHADHRRAASASFHNSDKVASTPCLQSRANHCPEFDSLSQTSCFTEHTLISQCCLQSEVDDFCQSWDEALQREERRQSEDSHKDNSRISRSAVTADNPVWQKMR